MYQATTNIRGYKIGLLLGGSIPIEFIGFGDTHSEAMQKCLQKVDKFIHHNHITEEEEKVMEDTDVCVTCLKVSCMCYEDKLEREL